SLWVRHPDLKKGHYITFTTRTFAGSSSARGDVNYRDFSGAARPIRATTWERRDGLRATFFALSHASP
ncbi:hypothetical protein HAX54_043942, partial [Datura stramonium]|nr:hypothetical protein [Datura stramonium]